MPQSRVSTETVGHLTVLSAMTDDPSQKEYLIGRYMEDQKQLAGRKKFYHDNYFFSSAC